MNEPGRAATEGELAAYYDQHRGKGDWGEPQKADKPERPDVTISARFSPAEIAAVRARAKAAGEKATTYIRRRVLEADEAPIDRARVERWVEALAHDVEELRRAAGQAGLEAVHVARRHERRSLRG